MSTTVNVYGDTLASGEHARLKRATVKIHPSATPLTRASSKPSARQVGSYQLVRKVGYGGMGQVWEAVHTGLQKRVAIKFLSAELCAGRSAAMVERFLQEGVLACQVTHPNIVDVTDVGVHEEIPYLVMEFLDGLSLGERLQEGFIPWQEVVDLFLPVTAALHAAHKAGVVHRDIKPANIIMVKDTTGQPTPKLVDFGVSRLHGSDFTRVKLLLGTPGYMAPELMSGESRGDPLTDQYALGVTLYEVLVGSPVKGTSQVAPPRTVRPEIPEQLERVILRAMDPCPRRRFPDVREVGAALLPLARVRQRLNWEPILDPNEHSDTVTEPSTTSARHHRRRQVWGFYALLFLATLTIGGLGVIFWHQLAGRMAARRALAGNANAAANGNKASGNPNEVEVSPAGVQPLAVAVADLTAAPPAGPAALADVTPSTVLTGGPARGGRGQLKEKPRRPPRKKRKQVRRKPRRKKNAPKTDNRDPWAE